MLLSLYTIGSTEAYQLLKLPAFVVHFMQHSQKDPWLSLLGFIKEHYAEAQVLDADWMQDMQLPFKSSEFDMGLVSATYYPPASQWTLVSAGVLIPQMNLPGYHNDFVPGLYTADIFQPPRA